VAEALPKKPIEDAVLPWNTSPSSPGLNSRREMFVLHVAQSSGLVVGTEAEPQFQFQFQTHADAAEGENVLVSSASSAQFQFQFQVQVEGWTGATVCGTMVEDV
jgi:hypothetical protein